MRRTRGSAGSPPQARDARRLLAARAGYAIGNILSSVALVLLNKQVFKGGFNFPMTLTAFHFVFTIAFYEMLRYAGAFSRPSPDLPQIEKFKVGLAGFASIGFMNLSLKFNSVGFYQAESARPPPFRASAPRPKPAPSIAPRQDGLRPPAPRAPSARALAASCARWPSDADRSCGPASARSDHKAGIGARDPHHQCPRLQQARLHQDQDCALNPVGRRWRRGERRLSDAFCGRPPVALCCAPR